MSLWSWQHWIRLAACAGGLLTLGVSTAPVLAAPGATPDGVLIIHSNQRPTPAAIIIEDTLRKVVPDALGRPVELFSEYLDVERSSIENYSQVQAEFLRHKYGGRNIRVIVAAASPALLFLIEFRDRMLPGVPVVHIAAPTDLLARKTLPADIVGKTIDLSPLPTLELALRLQPKTKRLVIVLGAAERDRVWERRLRDDARRLEGRIEIDYLIGLPTADLLQRLRALTGNTIVYTPGYFVDGAGVVGTPRQSLEHIGGASAAPVYGPLDTFLGTGMVGGYMAPYDEQSKHAGEIVVHLLNGTPPTRIATSSMPNLPLVDWRQIRRFGIDERLLPADTVVRFREPNVWDRYWREISFAIALLIAQAGLIAALLVQRHRRRAAEHAAQLLRSEVAHASRLAIAGELTASIAHEINQPLGAILSNADAADLLLQSGEDRRDLLRQIMADIRRDDIRASEVIRRLRGLLAKHEVEQKPFDLSAAVSEAVAMLQAEAGRRQVAIDLRPAPAAHVVGDRIQIQQVVINLLLNAIDAVSETDADRRTVVVAVSSANGRIEISVRDQGHGISSDELPKLFNSFFSTKRAGMGVGLSIARTIVEAHGGRIWAESTLGDGAVFHVELPAAKHAEAHVHAEAAE